MTLAYYDIGTHRLWRITISIELDSQTCHQMQNRTNSIINSPTQHVMLDRFHCIKSLNAHISVAL